MNPDDVLSEFRALGIHGGRKDYPDRRLPWIDRAVWDVILASPSMVDLDNELDRLAAKVQKLY